MQIDFHQHHIIFSFLWNLTLVNLTEEPGESIPAACDVTESSARCWESDSDKWLVSVASRLKLVVRELTF